MEGQSFVIACAPPLPLEPGAFGTAEHGTIQLVEVPTSVCGTGWQIEVAASGTTVPAPRITAAPALGDSLPLVQAQSPVTGLEDMTLPAEAFATMFVIVLLCGVVLGFVFARARHRRVGLALLGGGGMPPAGPVRPRRPKLPPGNGSGTFVDGRLDKGGSELRIGRYDSWS